MFHHNVASFAHRNNKQKYILNFNPLSIIDILSSQRTGKKYSRLRTIYVPSLIQILSAVYTHSLTNLIVL